MRLKMFTIIAIILVETSLVVHEAGHAIAMRKRGVEVELMSIGMGAPKLRLPLKLSFPVYLAPLPIGAYVKPSRTGESQLNSLGYRDYAVCLGSGVLANLIFGTILADIHYLHDGLSYGLTGNQVTGLIVFNMASIVFGLGRRWLLPYLFPLLGIAVVGPVAYGVLSFLHHHTKATPPPISGPVGIAKLVPSHDLWYAITTAGLISLSIGLANLMPLIPLDGGRLVGRAIGCYSRIWAGLFIMFSTLAFFGIIGFAVLSDFGLFR